MVDRTSLQTIIYDAILIALTRRGFLYLALPITPCALTFPSLETSCKPLRRRESQNARNVALETLNRVVEAEYFYLNHQALFNIPTFNIPEIPGVCENIIRILFQIFIFLLLIFLP